MTNEEFLNEVEAQHLRSKKVLMRKQEEYAGETNRLEQFYRIGSVNKQNPAEACFSLAAKHITSIADMSKSPTSHNLKKWREKIGDLRNYTHLLEALVEEMGVE